ncbi:AUGMIN subunit 6 [Iris pallida]|uniref:AUGMIN subunit 6 n=1 Tax=Iris pallida TaxID=29817 RepID=A0AAX6G808_IRIPA|nr:AUGMIN subunit 6 [Iris pallida]
MTAEFRGLCAEEAFLQQELEKLQEMRTKAKMEAELWDDRISSSSAPSSHIVSKATRLWESLLARKSQHEVLASGPIEDLIAHREHRYRISGSSLLAAMDLSSPVRAGEISPPINNREQTQGNKNNDILPRTEDRSGRVHPTVDVAEILRRWTHALQRIHKQSLHLAKANDGEGPELLRCASDSGTSGHAESLAATLAEHRQHLASIQGLINQLKAAVPTMQKSIAELTEEVNTICPYPMDEYSARATSPVHAQTSGRSLENNSDEVTEMTSKLSSVQLDKASTSPALKLPHLFSLTPNSGKGLHTPKQYPASTQPSQAETLVVGKPVDPPFSNDHADSAPQEGDLYVAQNIRRSVRDAALSKPSSNSGWPEDKSSDDGSEHFFIPLPAGVPRKEVDAAPSRRKQRLFSSPPQIRTARSTKEHTLNTESRLSSVSSVSNNSNGVADHVNSANGLESATSMGSTGSGAQSTFLDVDESFEQPVPLNNFSLRSCSCMYMWSAATRGAHACASATGRLTRLPVEAPQHGLCLC